MRSRLTKVGAALAALTALAVGGSALASAAGNDSQPAKAKADVTATDPAGAADTDSIEGENGADDATEAAENGSETADDDGPGGWADEPGNPNADNEQQGEN